MGKTAISNKEQKMMKEGISMFEDYNMTADDIAKAIKISNFRQDLL